MHPLKEGCISFFVGGVAPGAVSGRPSGPRERQAGVVERWAEGVAEGMGFTEVEHTVELTGVCDRCGFTRIAPGPGSAEQRA